MTAKKPGKGFLDLGLPATIGPRIKRPRRLLNKRIKTPGHTTTPPIKKSRPTDPRPPWQDWLQDAPPQPAAPHPPDTAKPAVSIHPGTPRSVDDDRDQPPRLIDRTGGTGKRASKRPMTKKRDAAKPSTGFNLLTIGGVCLVIAAAIAIALTVTTGSPRATNASKRPLPAKAASSTIETAPQPAPHTADGCIQHRGTPQDITVSGTYPGDRKTAQGAIFGFEHAYYVARDGHQARGYATANANIQPGDEINRGIQLLPVGTRYCVTITSVTGDATSHEFLVAIVEQEPDKDPQTIRHIITTTKLENQYRITNIREAP